MTSPTDPFRDPEIRAEMERLGIVHAPGSAAASLAELAPLLAAEGIDLNDPDGIDITGIGMQGLQAALDRATERHNLELFTPVGAQRDAALRELGRFAHALADDDHEGAQAVLSEIGPYAHDGLPAAADVIGVGLGLLDTWLGEGGAGAVRVPKWGRPARAAATDILALARKGRAFDALDSLTIRHGGKAICEGAALLVAAVLRSRAAREDAPIDEVITGELGVDIGMPQPDGPEAEFAGANEGGGRQHPSSSLADEQSTSSQPPPLPRADRALIRAFGDWLDEQPETDIPSTGEGVRMLRAVFTLIRQSGRDPLSAADVQAFIDELADTDLPDEVFITLEEYTLFQLDATDDDEWDEVNDAIRSVQFDNAGHGGIVAAAMDAGAAVDADVRFDALMQVRVVSAVSGLLEWIGTSKPVAPSGGARLADIARIAELLGVPATGMTARRTADVSSQPLLAVDEPAADVARVKSMLEVPALVAWWRALSHVGLIEIAGSRVRPGEAAAEWTSAPTPPAETAEMLTALFLARLLTHHVDHRPSATDFEAVDTAIELVLAGIDVTGEFDLDVSASSRRDALAILQPAHDAGLCRLVDGRVVVTDALRLTVARGVTAAAMFLGEDALADSSDME